MVSKTFVIFIIIVFLFFTFVYYRSGLEDAVVAISPMIFPLGMILFSEQLSNYTGPMWSFGRVGTNITKQSPVFLVRFVGLIFALVLIIRYFILTTSILLY